ncbi:unnamed protein product, partial [Coregonus sp. 'balchen']
MYLYVRLDRDREVLKHYWDRVKTEGPVDQLTITITETILRVNTGAQFTMNCSTTLKDQDGMYLYVGLDKDIEELYYHQHDSKMKGYWDRVKTEGPVDQLTITVNNLTIEDTGVYWCVYTKLNKATFENDIKQGRGSTLVV